MLLVVRRRNNAVESEDNSSSSIQKQSRKHAVIAKYGPMIPPAHKAHQTVSFLDVTVFRHTLVISFIKCGSFLFVDVAIQTEVRFIAKQNSLMKIGNNGNLVLGPFDESTPCLMIVLMNCQTKLRINHLTAIKK
ncbi:hypothetical protein TNCV_1526081 [Trichonephila clavipes]|nr:hypothetical protein TNCV_1526081 [Trichonephila clavipes]